MSNTQPGISRVKWELGDLLAFIIPCLIFIEVRLVGRLFLPEMILLVLCPFLLRNRGRILWTGPPKTLIVLGLLWLSAQIITDGIRATPFADFSRGWSNIGIFLLEFSVIYLLVTKSERRVFLFAIGICIGQFLQYFIAPNIFAAGGETWKFGIGYAVTFLLILSTQLRWVRRVNNLGEAILLAAAVLNVVMESRSIGGICFIAALYLFVQRRTKPSQTVPPKVSPIKLVLAASILLVSGVVVLKFYGFVASSGMLGESSQQKYESQASGDFGLLIGGRQELLVSSLAIMDSPVIGHGSWAKDPKYIAMLPEMLSKYGYETPPISYDEELSDLIPTHSFLFGAWVNSGLLGAVFWFWVIVFCGKILLVLYKSREPLTPVIVFVGINLIWNVLFSPFGAETRLYTAYYLVLIMFVHRRLLIRQATQLQNGHPRQPGLGS
jgi:hypothetical protein